MIRLLHVSDLQCGEPYRPAVGQAVVRLAGTLDPEMTVVAGDLTQRARTEEYRTVRGLLDALPQPVVATPGNHDVPLYRIWERILTPYRKWRRHVSSELDSVTRIPGLTCVALNSAAPRRRIVAGHLGARQVQWAREALDGAPADDVRLLVTHHHFVPTPDGRGGRPLGRAERLLAAFEAMGVDLILGGHVHQTHLASSRVLVPGPEDDPGIPLVSAGTSASSRGRGEEVGRNTVNLVRLDGAEVSVEVYRYESDAGSFQPTTTHRFRRRQVLVGQESSASVRPSPWVMA